MPKTTIIQRTWENLLVRNEGVLRIAVDKWMKWSNNVIRNDLNRKYINKRKSSTAITATLTDWNYIESQGQTTLMPATLQIMQSGGTYAKKQLAIAGSFDVLNVSAVSAAQKMTAKLVREVTAATKAGIRTAITEGIKSGESMPEVAKRIRPLVGLTKSQTQSVLNYEALLNDKTKYPRLTQADIKRRVTAYTNKTQRLRAKTIARTETARAQNIGYTKSLEEEGVKQVEFKIAPTDYCAICEDLNGKIYTASAGADVIPVHPNCRCCMLPVIDDKAITEPLKSPLNKLTKKRVGVL